MWFRIAWGIDLVATIVLVGYFVSGSMRGTVSSFNLGLWLALLAIAGGVLAGSWTLRASHHSTAATLLAGALAVPCALLGLWLLTVILLPGRWN